MFDIRTAQLRVKAAGTDDDLGDGEFEAYASVFGNEDSYGDIVQPGAFNRTLGEWKQRGDTIPVLWGHDMSDPFANIGGLTSAEEDDHGLKVRGQLDLDNPTALQVFRLMKGRRTNRMSFAYAVRDSEQDGDNTLLKDLELYEVSVVQVPANDLAEVLTVKSASQALLKAGRSLSSKNETALREARDAIDSVLSSLGDGDEDQDKASGQSKAKPSASGEERTSAKPSVPGEEPKTGPSVDDLAAMYDYSAMLNGVER